MRDDKLAELLARWKIAIRDLAFSWERVAALLPETLSDESAAAFADGYRLLREAADKVEKVEKEFRL